MANCTFRPEKISKKYYKIKSLIDSHRSIPRKNDRSVNEIEYENQKPECTFKPSTTLSNTKRHKRST